MTAWVPWENKSSGQAQMASLVAISETQGFFFFSPFVYVSVSDWNAEPCVCHSSNWATNLGEGFMSLGDLWLGIFFLLRISIHLDRVKVVTGKFVLHRTLNKKFTYNLFPGLWTYLFLKNALFDMPSRGACWGESHEKDAYRRPWGRDKRKNREGQCTFF